MLIDVKASDVIRLLDAWIWIWYEPDFTKACSSSTKGVSNVYGVSNYHCKCTSAQV